MADPMRLGTFTEHELLASRALVYAQFLQCHAQMGGREYPALELFLERHPRSIGAPMVKKALDLRTTMWDDTRTTKAADLIGVTTPGSWASPLAALTELTSAVMTLARAESLLGRIPKLRRVAPNLPVPVVTGNGTFGWVGQSHVKPVTSLSLTSLTVPIAKALGLIVVTNELLKGAPGSAAMLRDCLIAGLANFLDEQLTDPAVAAVTGVSPGSITNGTTPTPATGDLAADISTLIGDFYAARPTAIAPALLMSPATAGDLAVRGAVRDLQAVMPVIITAAIGTKVIMLDAQAVAWAADDTLTVEYSKQATVEVSTTPTDPPTAATELVSLWQNNLIGLLVEQFVAWQRATIDAVKYLDTAAVTP